MKGTLNYINTREVLKYLGYKGGEVEAKTMDDISDIGDSVIKISTPVITFKVMDIVRDGGFALKDTNFVPLGENIREMLADCDRCIIMAATLGMGIEKELRSLQITNMYSAVIMDCCASAAIENVCDNFQTMLEHTYMQQGLFITDRFSPGYGDMPFSQQKELCGLLQTEKTIGVSLSSSGIMIPRKTVTAIMGISNSIPKKRFKGCEYCSMFENCSFRKGGDYCGRT